MNIERIYKEELTSPQRKMLRAFIMEMKGIKATRAYTICNGGGNLLPAEEKKVVEFLKKMELC